MGKQIKATEGLLIIFSVSLDVHRLTPVLFPPEKERDLRWIMALQDQQTLNWCTTCHKQFWARI